MLFRAHPGAGRGGARPSTVMVSVRAVLCDVAAGRLQVLARFCAGSAGAQVISELQPQPGERELISPKRAYGAFDGTGLDEKLRELGVDEVVLAGQHTHICVRHSSYGALIRGYEITIPSDAVCAFEGVDENDALDYLRNTYAARITSVDELVRVKAEAHASA